MKRLCYSILLVLPVILWSVVFFLPSCSVVDPAIPVPAYIHISKIGLTTNYSKQGSDSAKITDAWIYVNNQYIGTFQLPATVPVLGSGSSVISVDAGIEVSGISANRTSYPFFSQFTQTLNLVRGQKTTLNPVVTYLPQTVFKWLEDFESVSPSIIRNPNSNSDTAIQMIRTPALVYQGKGSGGIFLSNSKLVFEGIQSNPGYIPFNSDTSTYLELNYKSTSPFVVGLYPANETLPQGLYPVSAIPALTINPSATWNKIYVSLTAAAASYPSSIYTVYIFMAKDSANAFPALYLDNIKLVTF